MELLDCVVVAAAAAAAVAAAATNRYITIGFTLKTVRTQTRFGSPRGERACATGSGEITTVN